jgi:hypothetical protein
MKYLRFALVVALTPLLSLWSFGGDDSHPAAPKAPHMSHGTRLQIIKDFNADTVYIRAPFPMGTMGLKLRDGVLTPSGAELRQMMAMWGPAAKPGDAARISNVVIKDAYIHFEINGGPIRKSKWYQHITISGSGGSTPVAPSDSEANQRGSFVDRWVDGYVPELTGPQLKDLLRPVFDFESKSPLEAYLETVPPVVKTAITEHRVLVGMNREMVIYALGRPPRKLREKEGEVEHEEWIYGEPPHDVDFVRFIGDEVVQVETMKVGGEKVLRTAKEVELDHPAAVAQTEQNGGRPVNAPSLRRPGEDLPEQTPLDQQKVKINPIPKAPPPGTDPNPGTGPNYQVARLDPAGR